MGDLSVKYLLLKKKIVFESRLIKSNQSPRQRVDN